MNVIPVFLDVFDTQRFLALSQRLRSPSTNRTLQEASCPTEGQESS